MTSLARRAPGPTDRRTAIFSLAKNINLAVAFGLELATLASVTYWGFTRSPRIGPKLLLGLGSPILMIVLWSLFGAPGAAYALHGAVRIVFEIGWFGLGVLALALAGQTAPAVVFAAVFVVSTVLARVWHQQS